MFTNFFNVSIESNVNWDIIIINTLLEVSPIEFYDCMRFDWDVWRRCWSSCNQIVVGIEIKENEKNFKK